MTDAPTLGFLTVTDPSPAGFIGGLLVLNGQGRPLEFHCTAPVHPSRAQEILYGVTLRPYLLGEQIARTLAKKTRHRPVLFVTDVPEIVSARLLPEAPLLLVAAPGGAQPPSLPGQAPVWDWFALGTQHVAVCARFPDDKVVAIRYWQTQGETLDLEEPFQRIRDALQEAQRAA